jgi:nucleoside 2-deoxyribosyltransferase
MKNVFISYDHRNREFVSRLASLLEAEGFKAFLSGDELRSGANWPEGLKDQVRTADGFVLVMPAVTSSSSNNTFFEAGVARAFGKTVVVVVPDIAEVDRSNIPLDVANAVVVDAAKQPLKAVATTVLSAIDK